MSCHSCWARTRSSSTSGRLHGFESLAERRLLLALVFVGGVNELLSQRDLQQTARVEACSDQIRRTRIGQNRAAYDQW